jgi:hypothetical protein
MGPGACLDGCGKSRPNGIRSPDLPARSQSLYRLSYPGSTNKKCFKEKQRKKQIVTEHDDDDDDDDDDDNNNNF